MKINKLKHICEISILKDIFNLEPEEACSMFLSNDYRIIEFIIEEELGLMEEIK